MVSDQLSSKFYKANNVIPTLHILSQSDVEGVVSESHRALLSPGIQGRLASLTFCSPPYSLHSPSLQGYLPPLNVIITNKQQQQKLRAHVISKKQTCDYCKSEHIRRLCKDRLNPSNYPPNLSATTQAMFSVAAIQTKL